jgi:hypothetical protein
MMLRSRHLLFSIGALVCLAALLAACGGEAPAPADTPGATLPAATQPPAVTQPPATEFVSPLPEPIDTTEPDTDSPSMSPLPVDVVVPEPAPLTGEVPQGLLDAIFDDLAARLGTSREAIAVERSGVVTWRDGSLGCPQPGMMYTQALVPGYQVVLRVADETYDYHAGDGGYFILCPEGMAEEGLPPGEGGLVDQ